MAVQTQYTAAGWPEKFGPRMFGVADQGVNLPARLPLSPVEEPFPTITSSLPIEVQDQNRRLEAHQRSVLYEFTSLQLLNLDVITERQLHPNSLTNRILPIFQRNRWLSFLTGVAPPNFVAFDSLTNVNWVPLPNGIGGNWSANNDLVWNAITPSLQIASRILMGSPLLPFFDTLLHGKSKRTIVPKNRRLPGDRDRKGMRTLRARDRLPHAGLAERRALRDKFFSDLRWKRRMRLIFKPWGSDPVTGAPTAGCDGLTWMEEYPSSDIYLSLSYELVIPLLRPDLNDLERMSIQWFIANVLVHETTHAIWYHEKWERFPKERSLKPVPPEPYYLNEPVSELGTSMEHAVFGGGAEPAIRYNNQSIVNKTPPFAYFLYTRWPDTKHGMDSADPVLINPPLHEYQHAFPIQASFYEDIQQEDFWRVGVRPFGPEILHARSLRQGTVWKRVPGAAGDDLHLEEQDLNYEFIRTHVRKLGQQGAQQLSPRERRISALGRRIEKGAQLQEIFWEQAGQGIEEDGNLRDFVSEIRDATAGGNQLDDVELLEDFMGSFNNARRVHDLATRSLLDSQEATGSDFIDRKKILIYWNRGARLLAHQITSIPAISNDAKWFFDNELEALEASRLHLLSPTDDRADAYDLASEINQLDTAWSYQNGKGTAELVAAFEIIQADEYCTLVTDACCDLVIAHFSVNDEPGDRQQNTLKALNRLRFYRNNLKYLQLPAQLHGEGTYVKGPCPPAWEGFLDSWIQRGIEFGNWHQNWSNVIPELLAEIQARRNN